jgi:hypothetical protein
MKTVQAHIRMTEQTKQELSVLVKQSVSTTLSEYIRQLVHSEYQKLNRGETMNKNTIINKIEDLNLGYLEEADDMTIAELESLYYDLKAAQDKGDLNIETDQGIENLKNIVDKYI